VTGENLLGALLYEKRAHKMLMKLTIGGVGQIQTLNYGGLMVLSKQSLKENRLHLSLRLQHLFYSLHFAVIEK